MAIKRRIKPNELLDAGADPDSVSVSFALLSVAPNSMWPIQVPASPPAIPASKGLR